MARTSKANEEETRTNLQGDEAPRTAETDARDKAVEKVESAAGQPVTGDPLNFGQRVPMDVGALAQARATIDTAGNAGLADHDIRRGTAAFDALTLATKDELPEHLAKYVDSPSGLVGITERAAEARRDSDENDEKK